MRFLQENSDREMIGPTRKGKKSMTDNKCCNLFYVTYNLRLCIIQLTTFCSKIRTSKRLAKIQADQLLMFRYIN